MMTDGPSKKRKQSDTDIGGTTIKFTLSRQNQTAVEVLGPPEIDASEITLTKPIGEGSFGTVYLGKCRQKDVAVKILTKKMEAEALSDFRKEVSICRACTSVPEKLMIVSELMSGDLESIIYDQEKTEKDLPILKRMKMAKDAALGVLWLHGSHPSIIHRDLKINNLLVDNHTGLVKVCDFGLSQVQSTSYLRDGSEGAKGTPLWMAPEAFGLILWSLVTRQEPYPEFNTLEEFTSAICYKHHRPIIPENCDNDLRALISRCWDPNPVNRPDFQLITSTLNQIIINYAIEDEIGRIFWAQFFLENEQAKWDEFLDNFCQILGLAIGIQRPISDVFRNDPALLAPQVVQNFECLKYILVVPHNGNSDSMETDHEIVQMEQFGKACAWFGNIRQDGASVLDKIRQLMQQNWFHGDISTPESENRLMNKAEGTFLLRFSTSERGNYTISKVSRGNVITHQRVHHIPGRDYFEISGRVYQNLEGLVNSESGELNLVYACTGSRFLSIFQKTKTGYIS